MPKKKNRSPVADFLESYSRVHRGDLLNPDNSVNTGAWARLTSLSQPAIYRILSGETRHPRYETIQQIGAATGRSESEILGQTVGDKAGRSGRPDISSDALECAQKLDRLPDSVRQAIMRQVDAVLTLVEPSGGLPPGPGAGSPARSRDATQAQDAARRKRAARRALALSIDG